MYAKIQSVIVKEERVLRMFEKWVLKRIFRLKDVTGDWRKLHYEGIHYLYPSPDIMRIVK